MAGEASPVPTLTIGLTTGEKKRINKTTYNIVFIYKQALQIRAFYVFQKNRQPTFRSR
jgi:hypothetical protein